MMNSRYVTHLGQDVLTINPALLELLCAGLLIMFAVFHVSPSFLSCMSLCQFQL